MSTGLYELTGITQNAAGINEPVLDTGDLRRSYNFGSKEMARISPDRQPYVHILSLFKNNPTDDSQFKFVESRPSFNKRYGYVIGHGQSSISITNDATITSANVAVDNTYQFRIATDYAYSGNLAPRIKRGGLKPAQTGVDGTRPHWIIPGIIITIKGYSSATALSSWDDGGTYNGTALKGLTPNDFINVQVDSIVTGTGYVDVSCTVKRAPTSTYFELTSFYDYNVPMNATGAAHPNLFPNNSEDWGLEAKRCYASGNAWAQGSGLPETWVDQPFSVGTGLTQIVKTTLSFDNTTMATVLNLNPNEYLRVYGEKLFEHQVDKAQAMYWSHQSIVEATDHSKPKQFTQGTIDYSLSYGNQFTWTSATNRDDFQQQLTELKAVGNILPNEMMFFADTVFYNWLFSLSGYQLQNLKVGSSDGYRAILDITPSGTVAVGGVTFTIFATPIGKIKVAEDPMLNGSPVAMFGVSVPDVEYRPLIGNGHNRDTKVYRGVQKIETTGIDVTTDLIQTEFALTHSRPERMAVWVRG